jgi:hypothetical protein
VAQRTASNSTLQERDEKSPVDLRRQSDSDAVTNFNGGALFGTGAKSCTGND